MRPSVRGATIATRFASNVIVALASSSSLTLGVAVTSWIPAMRCAMVSSVTTESGAVTFASDDAVALSAGVPRRLVKKMRATRIAATMAMRGHRRRMNEANPSRPPLGDGANGDWPEGSGVVTVGLEEL